MRSDIQHHSHRCDNIICNAFLFIFHLKSVPDTLRIFRALQLSTTMPGAVFEACVDVLTESNFTQEFLNVFANEKRSVHSLTASQDYCF